MNVSYNFNSAKKVTVMGKKKISVSTLNYITAILFYLASIVNFINDKNTLGIVWLCLGSTYICLASLNAKRKKDTDEKKN